MQRISLPTLTPIFSRRTFASRPTQVRLTVLTVLPALLTFSSNTMGASLSACSRVIRYAPFFCISSIKRSAMLRKAKTSFSAIQGRLLSKEHPSMMSLPAFAMSAVSSTMTGGLPAPAPIAFFPEESTALTTPGPPVQTRRRIFGCVCMILALSSVGLTMEQTRTFGPPAA